MSRSCVFCRIAAGEAPAQILRSTPEVVAFRDLHPQAPTHVLIIPRKHVSSVAALADEDAHLGAILLTTARDLARELGIEGSGYRLVVNHGPHGGQSVFHLHLHLLGGRPMGWPPG